MKIEKNIPIPESKKKTNPAYDAIRAAVSIMEIGDSILIPYNVLSKNSFTAKKYFEKKYKVKLSQRTTPNGIRVWRVG